MPNIIEMQFPISRYRRARRLTAGEIGGAGRVRSARLLLVPEVPPEVRAYYERGREIGRLVDQFARITAEEGDARRLRADDSSADVVLLLGPLYHLTHRRERLQALSEASRVLRPGGILFAAAISRFAALFDVLVRLDRLHEPDVRQAVDSAVADGVFRGDAGGLFTTAYFHRPADLRDELTDTGFAGVEVFNVEGPGFVENDLQRRWEDSDRRDALLRAARLVETEPDLLAAAGHLLTVGRRGPAQASTLR